MNKIIWHQVIPVGYSMIAAGMNNRERLCLGQGLLTFLISLPLRRT